ncbi:1-deoxy-D-xylulose-5-phosphate synthase N-terminal domain-containing protein [Longimicrobium terrae]|uniref:Transketolase n=1 Tax=Longimicrobium terrae TaxID=1639882 RepID=A0A841H082_9BACT|nr:transketolase [Longimicrobium terrae]MBB6071423.1 transketolase [Longimicrobium terrae]
MSSDAPLAPLDAAVLRRHAREIRRLTLTSIHQAQTGHAGPSLSMVEILTLLYFRHLRYDPRDPRAEWRDRFVLSKGHGAPGLYATLAHAGVLPREELGSLRRLGTRLQGHPNARDLPGVDASTGSLGQGISIALGMALGFRMDGRSNRVFCILGDGELQEGQNWEAAMAAPALAVPNLVAIVDRNGFQSDGPTESIIPLGDLGAKWRAFGWDVHEVDGHDFHALDAALTAARTSPAPSVVVARTIKGKGVSYMEGVTHWHHHPISDPELAAALDEIEGSPA